MKNNKFLAALMLFFVAGGIILGQADSAELKLSLKEAQDYAIKHNKMVVSSRMDLEASKICGLRRYYSSSGKFFARR